MAGGSASESADGAGAGDGRPAAQPEPRRVSRPGLLEEAGRRSRRRRRAQALAALAAEMSAGKVTTLLVAGVNPLYDAPAALGFADGAGQGAVRRLAQRPRSTRRARSPTSWRRRAIPSSAGATPRCPAASSPCSSRASSRSTTPRACSTCSWRGARPPGSRARFAAAVAGAAPKPGAAPNTPAPNPSLAWHYVRANWAARLGAEPGSAAFEESVERGPAQRPVAGSAQAAPPGGPARRPRHGPATGRWLPARPRSSAACRSAHGLELQLYPHIALQRRTHREQRLAARVPRPDHPHHLGRRRLDRAPPLRRDGARERRPGRGRRRPRQGRGSGLPPRRHAPRPGGAAARPRPQRLRRHRQRHRPERLPAAHARRGPRARARACR